MSFDHLPRHEDVAGRMSELRKLLAPSRLFAIAAEQTGRGDDARRQRYLDLMWLIGHIEPKPQEAGR